MISPLAVTSRDVYLRCLGFFQSLQGRLEQVEYATCNIEEENELWKEDLDANLNAWRKLSSQGEYSMGFHPEIVN